MQAGPPAGDGRRRSSRHSLCYRREKSYLCGLSISKIQVPVPGSGSCPGSRPWRRGQFSAEFRPIYTKERVYRVPCGSPSAGICVWDHPWGAVGKGARQTLSESNEWFSSLCRGFSLFFSFVSFLVWRPDLHALGDILISTPKHPLNRACV